MHCTSGPYTVHASGRCVTLMHTCRCTSSWRIQIRYCHGRRGGCLRRTAESLEGSGTPSCSSCSATPPAGTLLVRATLHCATNSPLLSHFASPSRFVHYPASIFVGTLHTVSIITDDSDDSGHRFGELPFISRIYRGVKGATCCKGKKQARDLRATECTRTVSLPPVCL